MEQSRPGDPKSHNSASWTIAMFVVLIAYPLSVAPVGKLLEAFYGEPLPPAIEDRLMLLYYPLVKAAEHSQTVRQFYSWYFKLWNV